MYVACIIYDYYFIYLVREVKCGSARTKKTYAINIDSLLTCMYAIVRHWQHFVKSLLNVDVNC